MPQVKQGKYNKTLVMSLKGALLHLTTMVWQILGGGVRDYQYLVIKCLKAAPVKD